MLAIRMQRTGRKGHAQFRVVVQDSRRTPTSGKVVYALGSYNPHTKTAILDKEKAAFYLEHGAQPSERVARLLKSEGVKLPGWVKLSADKERSIRNPEKRRSTAPEEPVEEASAEEAPADSAETEAPAEVAEAATESTDETPAEPAEANAEANAAETAEQPEETTEAEAEAPAEEPKEA